MAARSSFSGLALLAVLAAGAPGAWAQGWEKLAKPSPGQPEVIGGYAAGCIGGAVALPVDGVGYQAVRISRNRYWGHPLTVRMVQKLGQALNQMGLPPIYIGDLSQPRGGPMPGDHASHQTGLDADIWFTLAPKPALAAAQRENPELPWVVTRDQQQIDLKVWRPEHATMLRLTAQMPEVERIFVHWQIKKHLCQTVQGDRSWLTKVRPWWGHTEHFHVRLACPGGSPLCGSQPPNPPGDGCGGELAWWLDQGTPEKLRAAAAQPQGRRAPPKLPSQCYGIYGKM